MYICLYCAKYGVIKDVTKYSICVVIVSGHHHIVVVRLYFKLRVCLITQTSSEFTED